MEHANEILSLLDQIKKLNLKKKELVETLNNRYNLVLEDMTRKGLSTFEFDGIIFEQKEIVKKVNLNKGEKIKKIDSLLQENKVYLDKNEIEDLLNFEKNRIQKNILKLTNKKY